jgi:hypothetical protein
VGPAYALISKELRIIEESTGEEIAVIYPTLGYAKADIANARLIAAAPKLLAALIDLLGDRPSVQEGRCIRCGREYGEYKPDWAIETGDCPSDDCPSFIARAAIAEATAA